MGSRLIKDVIIPKHSLWEVGLVNEHQLKMKNAFWNQMDTKILDNWTLSYSCNINCCCSNGNYVIRAIWFTEYIHINLAVNFYYS